MYSICDFPDKNINISKCSYVLNRCSEYPGLFVPDAKMNGDRDLYLTFMDFYHYKNISSCYFQKHIFPEHGKHVLHA